MSCKLIGGEMVVQPRKTLHAVGVVCLVDICTASDGPRAVHWFIREVVVRMNSKLRGKTTA